MHGQALGAPMRGKQAYSTVSLLSQSGRLPLASIQASSERAIARIMTLMLEDIAENDPSADYRKENEKLLSSQDVKNLGDFEVSVTLDVKLSQDAFREAQVAGQLKGTISEEMIRQDILHITDEEAMVKAIIKEQMRAEMVKAMIPQSIESLMQMMQGASGQGAGMQGASMQGQPTPEQMAMMQAQGQGAGGQVASGPQGTAIPPEIMSQLQSLFPPEKVAEIEQAIQSGQMTPEQLMQMIGQIAGGGNMQGERVAQGNPMEAMAGGGRMPMTEPMPPEQIG